MSTGLVTRGTYGVASGAAVSLATHGLFPGAWGVPEVEPKKEGGFQITLPPSPVYTLTSSPQYQLPSGERIKLL